jgi:hypothetical protein
MEHCLDLDGFVKGLNMVCSKYFYCNCPYAGKPWAWDVAVHPFMAHSHDSAALWKNGVLTEEAVTKCERGIRKCFPEFDLLWAPDIGYKNSISMVLEKKGN